MTETEIPPELHEVMLRIKKLLNLAAKNPSQEEAALATAKAQELLTRYNLSHAAVDQVAEGGGRRVEDKVAGGDFKWQRDLWSAVAELNFCLHYTAPVWEKAKKRVRNWETGGTRIIDGEVRKMKHALIGRQVNVAATIAMAGYLEQAIDRLTVERCEKGKIPLMNKWTMSFREGAAYRVRQALRERRMTLEQKHQAELKEAAMRAGTSMASALTIADFSQTEEDANTDMACGLPPGTTTKDRIKRAEKQRLAEEAYTKWAAEHPEEARAKEEERKKAREKRIKRLSRQRFGAVKYDTAFWEGNDKAKEISLDQQVDTERATKFIA